MTTYCEHCYNSQIDPLSVLTGTPQDCPFCVFKLESEMSNEKPKTRMYRFPTMVPGEKDRLIRAVNSAAADRHGNKGRASKLATQDDIAELIKAGVEPEDATD